jgi:hypothetical protein
VYGQADREKEKAASNWANTVQKASNYVTRHLMDSEREGSGGSENEKWGWPEEGHFGRWIIS